MRELWPISREQENSKIDWQRQCSPRAGSLTVDFRKSRRLIAGLYLNRDLPGPLLIRFPVGFLQLDGRIARGGLDAIFLVGSAGNDLVLARVRIFPIEAEETPGVFLSRRPIDRSRHPRS